MSEGRTGGWGKSIQPLLLGIVSGLLLALVLSALSSGAQEVTILYTNDIHGSFLPQKAKWREDGRLVGGFEALADKVRAMRDEGRSLLLLDAGDLMTGNPICDQEVGGAKGGALVELMNAIQYDAMALGNHELDISQENALALESLADFPFLSCNLVREDGTLFTGQSAIVKKVGELDVGIIGVITEGLGGVVQRDKMEGLRVLEARKTVQTLADSLDPLTDLIVVLSHMGADDDRDLAKQIQNVDVIVGGHSHTRIKEPELMGDVLVVQTGGNLTEVGHLDLEVKDDRVARFEGRLTNLWIDEMNPQSDIRESVEHFQSVVQESFGEVLGQLKVRWKRTGGGESNIGNWIADVMRERFNADFAFINSGGIRKDMFPGPIRRLDIYEMLPFENEICQFSCTGEELMDIIRKNAEAQSRDSYGILQISGIRYTFWAGAGGVKIHDAEVGGRTIDPSATYDGISVDFVVLSQPEKYLGYSPEDVYRTGHVLNGFVAKAVTEAGSVENQVEGRIRRLRK
jgi:2',3'-cyclic-nucleotide 2'-phosphodiesterase (5'-nucleotidase family)